MFGHKQCCGIAVLVGAVFAAWARPAPAQGFRFIPNQQFRTNANFLMNPGLAQAQYLYNRQAVQQAQVYGGLPNSLYGQQIHAQQLYLQQLYAQAYAQQAAAVNPLINPYGAGGYNPLSPGAYTNPYASSYANPYTDPYSAGGSAGYGGYGYPYQLYPYEGYFKGTADIMRAYGSVLKDQEQARILHEAAKQARLETERKRFDLQRYIKENTPTFTEEQAKIAREVLKRVQVTSNPYEIASGSSLNTLLKDLANLRGKRATLEPIPIPESVLRRLNVTNPKGTGNLGLLRDDGRFRWPVALQELVSEEKQKDMEIKAQGLIGRARNNKIETNDLQSLQADVEQIREKLSKKVNDMPTAQYMEAKRFLRDFDAALHAVRDGDVIPYYNFQKFVSTGRTVQEVADYMIQNGLLFAPATQGDESAYQALHSALAAYDVALNNQLAAAAPPPKE